MANKVLTEQEVAIVGGSNASYTTNLTCTAGRAGALNCNVTSPSGATTNQLITGVSKKPSSVTVTGHYLEVYTYPVANIAGIGGINDVPNFYVRYYTTYSDGTSSYITVTSSATIQYGKNSSNSAPSSWSNDPGGCQYTVGYNSSASIQIIGYAFIKATYNGYSDYDSSQIRQDVSPKPGDFTFYIIVSPANLTSPIASFYRNQDDSSNPASTTGRVTGSGEHQGVWYKEGTITKVRFYENGSNLKQVEIVGYDGTRYLPKQQFSTNTFIPLTVSFDSSTYDAGTRTLYLYYYNS